MQALRLFTRRKLAASLFMAAALALIRIPSGLCQGIASIGGQVTTQNGGIIPYGVMVRLETNLDQTVALQPADSSGHYEFDGLRKVDYRLVITASGYRTVERDVNLRFSANNVTVNIRLTPKNKVQVNKGYVTSVAELKIPERAKREYRKGQRTFRAHHFSHAERYYRQAIKDYPCYAKAQTGLATTLIVRGKHLPEAEARLRKAIKCDASFLNAYEVLAQLLNAENQYAESVQVLKRGLERSPGLWQFHYQMGMARFGMKDYGEAEKELRKVSTLDKAPPPILYVKLADVYLKESKYDNAYDEMKDYLQASPKGRFAPRVRTVMKQMKAAGVLSPKTTSN